MWEGRRSVVGGLECGGRGEGVWEGVRCVEGSGEVWEGWRSVVGGVRCGFGGVDVGGGRVRCGWDR